MKYKIHFDGGCGPINPGGTASYGYTIRADDWETKGNGIIGSGSGMTNNLAEYHALGYAFDALIVHGIISTDKVQVIGDSQLVIKTMRGTYNGNKPDMAYYPGWLHASKGLVYLKDKGISVDFKWVRREENTECDDLSKINRK